MLPDSLLPSWQGFPDDGRHPLDKSHDYGRACATAGYAELLSVGDAYALVFGENEYGGVWLGSRYPILFEMVYAESDDSVIDLLAQLPANLDAKESIEFIVASDHLNVFDSAFPGHEFERQNSCRFSVQAGTYAVESSVYEPNAKTALILHRFRPV